MRIGQEVVFEYEDGFERFLCAICKKPHVYLDKDRSVGCPDPEHQSIGRISSPGTIRVWEEKVAA